MHAWKDAAPGRYFMATLDDIARLVEPLGFVEIERVAKKTAAVEKGDLRPGHLRARKPG